MNEIGSSDDGKHATWKQTQKRDAFITVIGSGWALLALATFISGGLSAFTSEQIISLILWWPVTLAYLSLVALPSLLVVASLIVKRAWVSIALFFVAIVSQIYAWPEVVECKRNMLDKCDDAYLTYRWAVWGSWPIATILFAIQVVTRVMNHVNSDPYIVALKQRREKDSQSD